MFISLEKRPQLPKRFVIHVTYERKLFPPPLCPPSQTAIFVYYRLDVYVCLFAVHSLPHLTVLSLSGCSKITDDGVELIAENLQKLRALDLSWCPRITDAALEYIACDLNMLEELTLDRFGL